MGGGDASVAPNNDRGSGENNRNRGTSVDSADAAVTDVRYSNGSKLSVQASLESTVGSFKSVLAQNCEVPVEQQRLIYKGRMSMGRMRRAPRAPPALQQRLPDVVRPHPS